jgi:protein-tyrosine phosphatase
MTPTRWRMLLILCGAVVAWLACDACQPADSVPAIPFESASVSAQGDASYSVSWRADGVRHVRVLAGPDLEHIDRPVAEGGRSGEATVSGLPQAARWFFELEPDRGGPLIITDRSLHLTTAANFRDAGGYRTQDGKWVRMGLVYRSNGLEHLSDEELARIDRLHIKLVCDLRTAEERQSGPDRVPEGVADQPADVLADDADLIHSLRSNDGRAAPSHEALEERIYRDFVRLPSARQAYRALFERLADPENLPTVFHCTAGKDRTGWAQAVFLTLLGVPRETVVEDYLLTNRYLQGAALQSVRQSMNGGTSPAITANPQALDAAFDQVARDYGSFERYLREGLHLTDATLAALRKNFLAG